MINRITADFIAVLSDITALGIATVSGLRACPLWEDFGDRLSGFVTQCLYSGRNCDMCRFLYSKGYEYDDLASEIVLFILCKCDYVLDTLVRSGPTAAMKLCSAICNRRLIDLCRKAGRAPDITYVLQGDSLINSSRNTLDEKIIRGTAQSAVSQLVHDTLAGRPAEQLALLVKYTNTKPQQLAASIIRKGSADTYRELIDNAAENLDDLPAIFHESSKNVNEIAQCISKQAYKATKRLSKAAAATGMKPEDINDFVDRGDCICRILTGRDAA